MLTWLLPSVIRLVQAKCSCQVEIAQLIKSPAEGTISTWLIKHLSDYSADNTVTSMVRTLNALV